MKSFKLPLGGVKPENRKTAPLLFCPAFTILLKVLFYQLVLVISCFSKLLT